MNYKINKYPDGSSYVTIPKEWSNINLELTFKINSYEDFWHLVQLCEVLTYNLCTVTIKIPNLLGAQADRRFNENESSDLRKIAEILNEYDNIFFEIFHPHNPEVIEALLDNVEIIDNSEFIDKHILPKIIGTGYSNIWDGNKQKNLILMSSDAGGFKPLMKLCDKIDWQGETSSASKSREYVDGKSKLTQILPSFNLDKDILIIDDISVYGGTFKGLSKALKSVGHKGKLYLAVSHMTVQNLGEDPVTNYFDKVFTTNSKFNNYYAPDGVGGTQPKNLEIIKLF